MTARLIKCPPRARDNDTDDQRPGVRLRENTDRQRDRALGAECDGHMVSTSHIITGQAILGLGREIRSVMMKIGGSVRISELSLPSPRSLLYVIMS